MNTTTASWAKVGILVAAFGLAASPPTSGGKVRGKVDVGTAYGPVVVYLDGIDGPLKYDPPSDVPRMSQKNAQFSPQFLVVAAGQSVEMPNDDRIVHNVFSVSKTQPFDLGLYPKGESRKVGFRSPGVVDLNCSIHARMAATIFVAPSPWHATADAAGAFEIPNVPPGRYKVRAWNRKGPELSSTVDVADGADSVVEFKP